MATPLTRQQLQRSYIGPGGRRFTFKEASQNQTSAGGDSSLAGASGGGSVEGTAQPIDIGALFPEFKPITFPTIKSAPFNFTDPQAFAQKFGEFNRGEVQKNFGAAKGLALDALDTELQGLQSYAPAAAALKREQISLDNQFNQMQRGAQVHSALPHAEADLEAQRKRSLSYASGRLPDDVTDRALELGVRSRAADSAGFSGIGPRSMQASKVSDLMSAEERFQIAQYGEGLFGQNLAATSNLFLAPTEYANTGQEIKATPEVGAGRLTYQGAGMINEATLLSPGQALSTQVNQEQFKTQLVQRTNEFNATGTFNARQFNSAGAFAAGLGLFNYQSGLANAQQAANQNVLDNQIAATTAGMGNGQFDAGAANASNAAAIQTGAAGTGMVPSAVSAISNALSPTSASAGTGPAVGGTTVNTAPSSTGSTAPSDVSVPAGPAYPGQSQGLLSGALGPDVTTPSSLRFAAGVPTPAGYVPTGTNGDGSYSAVNAADYSPAVQQLASRMNLPHGSVTIENAAVADRAVASSAGLSYVPISGFKQISLSDTGSPVYSTPAAAENGDSTLGRGNVNSLGLALANLGISDPDIYSAVGRLAGTVSDPSTLEQIDKAYSEGQTPAANAILDAVTGKEKVDTGTAAGQQLLAGAARIGSMWGDLSPAQKSLALSSLATPMIEKKTGEKLGDKEIPGTQRSVGGPLRVGDAMSLNAAGKNGFALARNWNQLSALTDMTGRKANAQTTMQIADAAGMAGFGPQGASVPVSGQDLKKVGAAPAPEYGVGAVSFRSVTDVPKHYKTISKTPEGGVIALPDNLAHTTPLTGEAVGALVAKKAKDIAMGSHPAQKNWSKNPARGIVRGSAGGSAIVSGLGTMTKANPALLSSIIAHSFLDNIVGV